MSNHSWRWQLAISRKKKRPTLNEQRLSLEPAGEKDCFSRCKEREQEKGEEKREMEQCEDGDGARYTNIGWTDTWRW